MTSTKRSYGPWDARQEAVSRTIYTEDDFRRVMAFFATRSSGTVTRVSVGGRIVFGGPLIIKRPLAVTVPGITVCASARFPIRAASLGVDCLFDVRAEMFCVEGLFVFGDVNGYFTTLVKNNGSSEPGRNGNNCRVLHNDFFGDRVYIDATDGDADEAMILGNRQVKANTNHDPSIEIDSERCIVSHNILDNTSGFGAVLVDVNGGDCEISGNDLGGADVTTSASLGRNTVYGNRSSGTLTTHGTDAVGLNT